MSKKCQQSGCSDYSISKSDFCWIHVKDKEAYRKNLEEFVGKGGSLQNENLAKADLSNLDLQGVVLQGANLSRVNLSNSNLFDANLMAAELVGADLTNCDLNSANLSKSDLTRAKLIGARLWHAKLMSANLIEADLAWGDFWNAYLFDARFWRTNFTSAISITKSSFERAGSKFVARCRINEGGIFSSEEAYRSLKKYFLANGRYHDASWASYKEKTMERLLFKKRKNIRYIPSLVMDLLCGYGEKPHRIVLSSFFVIFFYAITLGLLNAVNYTQLSEYKMSFGDYLYYSIITFTTVGYGDFIPKSFLLFRFLAASEAFIGAFMIGLFIFTLARKFSAR